MRVLDIESLDKGKFISFVTIQRICFLAFFEILLEY